MDGLGSQERATECADGVGVGVGAAEVESLPREHPEIKEAAKVNANMSRMLASFDTKFSFATTDHTRD